jgi:N utilization substance protein B
MDGGEHSRSGEGSGERTLSGSGPRRRAREIALQVLHQIDAGGEPRLDAAQAIARYFDHFVGGAEADEDGHADNLLDSGGRPVRQAAAQPERVDRPFLEELVRGVSARRDELDEVLANLSRNWRLERIALVERNVIRIALYELKYVQPVPVNVVLNEAVELAKRYGTTEGAAFVNGLLDRAVGELRG